MGLFIYASIRSRKTDRSPCSTRLENPLWSAVTGDASKWQSFTRNWLWYLFRGRRFRTALSSPDFLRTRKMSRLRTNPTKWHVCPAKTQIRLGIHPVCRVFAVRKKACVFSYSMSAERRLWSDWAGAQADLILRWAHSHFVGFAIMRRLKCCVEYSYLTSFGQKYDHFSLLCKQMDIYLRKVYIVRKVTSVPTVLAESNTCLRDVYRTRGVLKIDFLSAFHAISCTSFGHLVSYTCK